MKKKMNFHLAANNSHSSPLKT